jgi:hypothetical protein
MDVTALTALLREAEEHRGDPCYDDRMASVVTRSSRWQRFTHVAAVGEASNDPVLVPFRAG